MLANNNESLDLIPKICAEGKGTLLCETAIFLMYGFSYRELNTTLVPEIVVQSTPGISSKQFVHYFQGYNSGIFS